MKIEISKKYRTRNGEIVSILEIIDHSDFPVVGVIKSSALICVALYWAIDGQHGIAKGHRLDLISEVKDVD